MRALLQRVSEANVKIRDIVEGEISNGLLILLGMEAEDNEEDVEWLTKKVVNMRIFNDEQSVMNLSIQDVQGEVLVISQFTLHASTKKGNRPSYIRAARPETAIPLYELFIDKMNALLTSQVQKGVFGEDMKVGLVNDGPVTIWLDSKNKEY